MNRLASGALLAMAGCSFHLDHPPPYHPHQARPPVCEESRVRPILDTWGAAASAAMITASLTCEDTPQDPYQCVGAVIAVPVGLVAGIVFTWAAVQGYGMTHECRCAHAAWAAFHSPPPIQTPVRTIPPPTVPCDQLRADYRAASDPQKRFELVKQIRAYCRERPSAAPPPVPQ